MAKFRLSRPAERDLDEIWLYIARDDLSAADRLINAIVETNITACRKPKDGPRTQRTETVVTKHFSWKPFNHLSSD